MRMRQKEQHAEGPERMARSQQQVPAEGRSAGRRLIFWIVGYRQTWNLNWLLTWLLSWWVAGKLASRCPLLNVASLLAGIWSAAKGQTPPRMDSGLVQAEAQAHGQNAGMSCHHQGNQHLGLAEGGNHGKNWRQVGTILRPRLATVQIHGPCCHSS